MHAGRVNAGMRPPPQLALHPRAQRSGSGCHGTGQRTVALVKEAGVEVAGIAAFLESGDELVGEVVRTGVMDQDVRAGAPTHQVSLLRYGVQALTRFGRSAARRCGSSSCM
jgi:hypothetical protein